MGRKRKVEEEEPEIIIEKCENEIKKLKEKQKEARARAELNRYKKFDSFIELVESYYGKTDESVIAEITEILTEHFLEKNMVKGDYCEK